jgi:hypothetical protein
MTLLSPYVVIYIAGHAFTNGSMLKLPPLMLVSSSRAALSARLTFLQIHWSLYMAGAHLHLNQNPRKTQWI